MTQPSRRDCLDKIEVAQATHAGLWLDKYLPRQLKKDESLKKEEKNPITEHFSTTAAIKVFQEYENFYKRWETTVKNAGATCHIAKVNGRMAVGMGVESVLENSVSIHRTYGVPYIPGSALKGLAAHYANKQINSEWKKARPKGTDGKPEINPFTVLFGDTDIAGYVTFYDALYVPGSAKEDKPLALDVMTVHHPDYYSGKDVPPADWDSPTPISFLSATGSYLIALGGPQEWVEAAFKILACALRDEGVGAKTSSGYGRMKVDGVDVPPKRATQPEIVAKVEPELAAPIETHKGVITEINPGKYYGKVKDLANEKEYRFDIKAVVGNTPGKKATVTFEVQDGKVIKVTRL